MVFLRLFDNKTLALNISPNSTTLGELNQKITDRLGIPVENQCLLTSSRKLIGDSASLISDLGIGLNSTLTLNVSIFGGMQGLFASAEYDEDDKEADADAVWEAVDERMDSRRKDRMEARLKEKIDKYRKSNPKITEQFANLLKRNLHTMSTDEWDSIPEIGDYSMRNKKRRFESLDKARLGKSRGVGGTETCWSQTPVTDLTAVGEGRGTVLSLKLGRLSDSVSGHTVVDPKDLKSMKITSDAEISDIKKARLLLKSVTHINPRHGPGWIATAGLEEVAGKLKMARQLIE